MRETWRSYPLHAMAAILFLLAMVACSGGGKPAPAPAPAAPPASPQPAGAAAVNPLEEGPGLALEGTASSEALALVRKPWKGDFDGMAKRRNIRVLTTYSKTNYFLDGPDQKGLTYDGLVEFEKVINAKLKTKPANRVQVMIVPVSRDQLLPGLVEGRGDIAAAELTVTPERRKTVDFSDPIATGVREVPVVGPGVLPPKSPEDLSGKEVYVRRSSSYFESLTRLNEKLKAAGKPPVVIVPADENLEDEDLLEMVGAGIIPLVVVDEHKAAFWKDVVPGLTPCPGAAVRTGGELSWAFRKGSPKLKAEVNAFVKTHKIGTTFGNILLQKYLKDTEWIKNPATEQEMAKFMQTVALFKKYGNQYGFDYTLLAAQGYQESQLDQSKRSPRGALGIMQMMPKTAAAPPIQIPDISKADKNVEAGVKYLGHIRDTYFADAKMDKVDKGLFCFAAYNAGPSRIAALRKKAERSGLNPNKWFGNVEVVAAREIGRETVQYVSNIYKYYVSYRLIAEQEQKRKDAERKASAKPS